jgi:hypothetical protein
MRRKVLLPELPERVNGFPHLLQVDPTAWADDQVLVEAQPIGGRQGPFKILRQQLNEFLATEFLGWTCHESA